MFPLISAQVWNTDLVEPHVWADVGLTPGYALEAEATESLDGDFTLIGWYKDVAHADMTIRLWDIGSLEVEVSGASGAYQLDIIDANGSGSFGVDWNLDTWVCFIIVRSGTTFTCYENKTSLGTYESSPLIDYGTTIRMITDSCKAADLKVVPRAMDQDDINYYYDNVTERAGEEVLPNY